MNTGEYYNSQANDSERIAKKRRNRTVDLSFNWIFLGVLSFAGFWILLCDVDTYQSEKLFYRMLNDGLTIEEADSPYMAEGMRRNMDFKGKTMTSFFFTKWGPRVPIYLGLILLPIVVAGIRAFRYDRIRMNWAYYPLIAVSLAYVVYFWGKMHAVW